MRRLDPRTVSLVAISAALVAVSTLVFSVNIPATEGYFNLGETMIYIVAILFGPRIGAFAGGVGASVADLILAPVFAPATLIIKAAEGFIVGFLIRKRPMITSISRWRSFSAIGALAIVLLVGFFGTSYYWDLPANATLGLPLSGWTSSFKILIPTMFWISLACVAGIAIVLAAMTIEPRIAWSILSVVVGGMEMVLGYFLYEIPLKGLPAAIGEVPFNIGQLTVGLIVSLPVARTLGRQKTFPKLKKDETRIY